MKVDLLERPLSERFQHLLGVMQSKSFLSMANLANEVPFFICPFHPDEAVEMQRIIRQLCNQLSTLGIQVLNINLYDLCLEQIKKDGNWDLVMDFERENSKDELLELLQGMLDPQDVIIPAVREKISQQSCDLLFLSGIGEVFPYLRSHTLLNNLQSVVKDFPLVMFYPGKYMQVDDNNTSLVLFERLSGKQYYRAFNILKF